MSVSIDDLTFGAEFEVIMPRADGRTGEAGRAALARYLTENDIEARSEQYNHHLRTWWKITTDQSIGYDNSEIVSPILQGNAGLEQIKRSCRLIDDWGCRVNRGCGHHVHVGVRDRFAGQIGFFKELLKTYAKFAPVLDQLVAPSRRTGQNSYCYAVRYTPEMDRATSLDQLARLAGAGHFTNPNFYDAFTRHGTVEFRQHQGTVNGEKSANWIRLCLRLVAHAAKNTEPERAGSSVTSSRPRSRYVPGTDAEIDRDAAPLVERIDDVTRRSPRLTRLVIRGVASANPRRYGTQRYVNWQHYVVGEDLRSFVQRGGRLDIARHDVAEGYVRIADVSRAPVIAPAVPGRYEEIPLAPEPTVETTYEPFTITDLAPDTLEGLMELIGASDAERSYFEERMMELNP